MIDFGGVFSVLPTPFDSSGDFDPGGLRGVIDGLRTGIEFVRRAQSAGAAATTREALDRVLAWTEAAGLS